MNGVDDAFASCDGGKTLPTRLAIDQQEQQQEQQQHRLEGQPSSCPTSLSSALLPLSPGALDAPSQQYPEADDSRERAIELAKYFSASFIIPYESQPPVNAPRTPPDVTLSALAQLGVLKLQCDRAFISLIDQSFQYIVAEATVTSSISKNSTAQESSAIKGLERDIYLGFRALETGFGVCPLTIKVFTSDDLRIDSSNITADQTRYIIRDFLADPTYSSRPYVAGWPHMRSYAEVPLITPGGFVIGSYCVIDNKPHDFDDSEIATLADVASLVMDHLELMKRSQELNRVENLIHGIGSYVGESSSFQRISNNRPGLIQEVSESASRANSGRRPSRATASATSNAAITKATNLSTAASHTHTDPTTTTDGSMYDLEPSGSLDGTALVRKSRSGSDKNDTSTAMSEQVRAALLKASGLIRQGMEIQGVLFLDANIPNLRSKAGYSDTTTRLANADPVLPCTVLVHSVNDSSNDPSTSSSEDDFSISVRLLSRMLIRYPFGHIFSFDEAGVFVRRRTTSNVSRSHPSQYDVRHLQGRDEAHEGSEDDAADFDEAEDAQELLLSMKQARSIVFLPMWDFTKEKWSTAAIGWTIDPVRVLDRGDLNYLAAFGNSIMAEISRLEAIALSQAKSHFMSSISHELRSPLHGILGGTEMLRPSITVADDLRLVDTIQACGDMLLDTIDHLIDFTQVSGTSRKSYIDNVGSLRQQKPAQHPNHLTVVDLRNVVQDVVDGVYLGHRSKSSVQIQVSSKDKRYTVHNKVSVVVDIDSDGDFRFETEPGAWKRIIMNVFANSLKYTSSGQIIVKLSLQVSPESLPGSHKYVRLEVRDTGRGISSHYLEHNLFTPFAQENYLSDGTGLGLSIVKQLTNSLGGEIFVDSKVSIGTLVSVVVPFGAKLRALTDQLSTTGPSIISTWRMPLHIGELDGNTLYVVSTQEQIDDVNGEDDAVSAPMRSVEAIMVDMASNWLGMKASIVTASRPVRVEHDEKSHTWRIARRSGSASSPTWAVQVLASGQGDSQSPDTIARSTATLSSPVTPKTLAYALLSALIAELDLKSSARGGVSAIDDKETMVVSSKSDPLPANEVDNGSTSSEMSTTRHEMPSNAHQTENETRRPKPKAHLLLVDDNAINLKIMSVCLDRINCTYRKAGDGRQAVDIFKASSVPFDMIFMDISMPVMDGHDATREIRAYEQQCGLRPTRIYALTALRSADAEQRAISSGMNNFITKPISMKDIESIIRGATCP